jgi:translation initiation factor 2A
LKPAPLTQAEKEGPIHDVAWSPNSKEFGVVYGFMPAKTTIFNSKAQATHSFALGPRNTINFSPFGRFVLVAGFGNLAGQVDVYDITKDFAKVCTIEASNASVCEWSPNATHILFATTSPRLRVDNGVKIFHVGGGLMYNADMNELYDVFWRPRSGGAPVGDPLKIVPEPHASAKEVLAKAKPPSKPAGAYRPPGARGTTTPLHFKREDEGGAAVLPTNGASGLVPGANGFGRGARRREVPGAEPVEQLPPGAAAGGGVSLTPGAEGDEGLSKAALKNKKKREARKAKEAAAERDRADGGGDAAAMPLAPPGLEGAPTGPRAMSASPDRRGGGAFNHRRNRSGYENHHARSPQRAYNQGRGGGHQQGHASPHHPQQYQGGYQGAYQGQYHQQPYPHQQQQGQYHAPQAQQYQGGYQAQYDPAAAAQAYYGAPEAAASAPDVTVTSPGGGGSSSGGGGGPPGAGVAGGGGSGGGGAAAAAAANAQSDKKLRGLLKKLRAIEDLKMRQAAGERLEATQVQKIGTEDGVRRELEALGIAD